MAINENPGGGPSTAEGNRSRSSKERFEPTPACGQMQAQAPILDALIAEYSFKSWAGRLAVDDPPEFALLPPWEAEPEGVYKTDAKRFLWMLEPFAGAFTFQVFDDGAGKTPARVFHGSLDRYFDTLVSRNDQGAGVFVCINETDRKGRKAENVTQVRAVFVDLDGAPLAPVLEAKSAA